MSRVIVEGLGNLLHVKYLYVGETRAATYLGVTFLGDSPLLWSHSAWLFGRDWGL